MDDIGYKDGCLYVFELKKDRSEKAASQVMGYVKHIKDNRDYFEQILKIYPSFNVSCLLSDIKGICVMKYAYNMRESLVRNANKEGACVLFYEQAITFV